jgi:CHAD domain-containing protein
MLRVLEECDKAADGFAPDPVHDLRVALRRCRSMADGMMAIDPGPGWKQMKKAGRTLFRSLGELRDMQVMQEWVERLGEPEDPAAAKLLQFITGREEELKEHAVVALQSFDRKSWQEWAEELPRRAQRVRPDSPVFRQMALERWTEARELHRQAMRNRSQASMHRLRIGVKRFRYTVENFLPRLHHQWGDDLKQVQDLLGEVHDLDVLWATALQIGAFADPGSRQHWHETVTRERTLRVEKYRARALGNNSLWQQWRAGLPQDKEIQRAALSRLKLWASFLDSEVARTRRITGLALQLFDGLHSGGLVPESQGRPLRELLRAAALLHQVGKSKRSRSYHKASAGMVGHGMATPAGWTASDQALVAAVVRYHHGSLPKFAHPAFAALPAQQQNQVACLAGILRLALALDLNPEGAPQRISVQLSDGAVRIAIPGYSAYSSGAEDIAAARFLLERSLGRAIIVCPGGSASSEAASAAPPAPAALKLRAPRA